MSISLINFKIRFWTVDDILLESTVKVSPVYDSVLWGVPAKEDTAPEPLAWLGRLARSFPRRR